jgi:hypothetical protein
MQLFVVFALLSSALAFVPKSAPRTSSSSLQMSGEFSKSVPFLLKPKNLDGLIVSTYYYIALL